MSQGILTDMTQVAHEHPYYEVTFDIGFNAEIESRLNLVTRNRVILIGPTQSGKTAFVQNLVLRILSGTARGSLKGRRVFLLNKVSGKALEVLAREMNQTSLLVIENAHRYLVPENELTRLGLFSMIDAAVSVKRGEKREISNQISLIFFFSLFSQVFHLLLL